MTVLCELARHDLVFMSFKTSVFSHQTAETVRNLITTHNMLTSQSTAVRWVRLDWWWKVIYQYRSPEGQVKGVFRWSTFQVWSHFKVFPLLCSTTWELVEKSFAMMLMIILLNAFIYVCLWKKKVLLMFMFLFRRNFLFFFFYMFWKMSQHFLIFSCFHLKWVFCDIKRKKILAGGAKKPQLVYMLKKTSKLKQVKNIQDKYVCET